MFPETINMNGSMNGDAVSSTNITYNYERVERIARFLSSKTTIKPKLGIICGSGLNGITSQMKDGQIIKYKEIPDFPQSTVAGHDGVLVFGLLNSVPTVAMKGRFHSYEGHAPEKCALPVRVMKLLGVEVLIVTNAAGGLNPDYNAGDIMIIKDHISLPGLSGDSPLKGHNDERWGPRFPALNRAYDVNLIKKFENCANQLNLSEGLRKGVYFMVSGPAYETVAECRLMHLLGADAVGMSTTHEVTVAVHCGLKVLGLSLITNKTVMDWESVDTPNHTEVLEVAAKRAGDMELLINHFVSTIFNS